MESNLTDQGVMNQESLNKINKVVKGPKEDLNDVKFQINMVLEDIGNVL